MRNAAMATTQTTCCIRSAPDRPCAAGRQPVAATATASRSSDRIDMTSEPIRDRLADHLLTPQNAALVVIDYQPSQIETVRSMDHDLLLDNIVSVARIAKTYHLPIVLSSVNVANGQGHTLPELKAGLSDNPEIDRTQINSWEDVEFR